jgi:hypothetical protein
LCYAFNPRFYDIIVFHNCNAKSDSSTENSGSLYTNDTGLDGKTFLTGSQAFKVKEIEGFEITDFIAHPNPINVLVNAPTDLSDRPFRTLFWSGPQFLPASFRLSEFAANFASSLFSPGGAW